MFQIETGLVLRIFKVADDLRNVQEVRPIRKKRSSVRTVQSLPEDLSLKMQSVILVTMR